MIFSCIRNILFWLGGVQPSQKIGGLGNTRIPVFVPDGYVIVGSSKYLRLREANHQGASRKLCLANLSRPMVLKLFARSRMDQCTM